MVIFGEKLTDFGLFGQDNRDGVPWTFVPGWFHESFFRIRLANVAMPWRFGTYKTVVILWGYQIFVNKIIQHSETWSGLSLFPIPSAGGKLTSPLPPSLCKVKVPSCLGDCGSNPSPWAGINCPHIPLHFLKDVSFLSGSWVAVREWGVREELRSKSSM